MNIRSARQFYAGHIDTPLGQMIAIADDHALHLLAFTDLDSLEKDVERLTQKTRSNMRWIKSKPIEMIENELHAYFDGSLNAFKTPIARNGTDFSRSVCNALLNIPYGQTRSYGQLAASIGNPKAARAVGRANGCNDLAIIVPCHRVIYSNGSLGGYSGGIERKRWLIEHEKKLA